MSLRVCIYMINIEVYYKQCPYRMGVLSLPLSLSPEMSLTIATGVRDNRRDIGTG